jgi:hypothetical protein
MDILILLKINYISVTYPCFSRIKMHLCYLIFSAEVRLHEPELIQTRLEQGIRSRGDAVDSDCCVRARGLPWQASDQDIARFFVGLNVARYVQGTKRCSTLEHV